MSLRWPRSKRGDGWFISVLLCWRAELQDSSIMERWRSSAGSHYSETCLEWQNWQMKHQLNPLDLTCPSQKEPLLLVGLFAWLVLSWQHRTTAKGGERSSLGIVDYIMCYIAASNCKSGYLCTTSCSHLCVFIYLFILDADDLDDGDDIMVVLMEMMKMMVMVTMRSYMSFLQKLVSCGGLDVSSYRLAPFEISVLGDGRTAVEGRQHGTPPPPSPPKLHYYSTNGDWFPLVRRAACSLLAPFEIGYKTVDHCVRQRTAGRAVEFNPPTSPQSFGFSTDLDLEVKSPHRSTSSLFEVIEHVCVRVDHDLDRWMWPDLWKSVILNLKI